MGFLHLHASRMRILYAMSISIGFHVVGWTGIASFAPSMHLSSANPSPAPNWMTINIQNEQPQKTAPIIAVENTLPPLRQNLGSKKNHAPLQQHHAPPRTAHSTSIHYQLKHTPQSAVPSAPPHQITKSNVPPLTEIISSPSHVSSVPVPIPTEADHAIESLKKQDHFALLTHSLDSNNTNRFLGNGIINTELGSSSPHSLSAVQAVGSSQPAKLLQRKLPPYPLSARRRKAEGRVLLRAKIGREGQVMEVQIAETSGHTDLDQSAADTVKDWLFQPRKHRGIAVVSWVNIPIRFQRSGSSF
jgi:protein TonB